MNKNVFYVYLHRRASDNKVFYVGKGKDKRAFDKNNRSKYWKAVKNKHGLIVEIVFDSLTEEEAFQCEKDTILEMKYFCYPLVNHTDGGEGTSGMKQSPETVAKRVSKNLGQKRTEESKKAISDALTGRKFSESHCQSISNCQTGKKRSAESVAKRVKSNTGKTRSREQKDRMTEASKIKAQRYDYSSRFSGELNPQADKTVYTFLNIKTGEKFTGTRIQMCEKFDINPGTLRNLFSLKRKSAAGWSLLKETNDNTT